MSEQDPDDRRRSGLRDRLRRKVVRRRARLDGVSVRKVEIDRDIVMAGMAMMLLLLGASVGFTLYQQGRISTQQESIESAQEMISKNQDALAEQQVQLSRLERRDRINSYQTAYRFCSRFNVDRAAVHWLAGSQIIALSRRKARARRFADRYLRKLERKKGMPILDCDPNVVGDPARYEPTRKQKRFVRRWDLGLLTAAETGICKVKIGLIEDPRSCLRAR